jgi:O-acetyl-ADP-ribose deacetylase (regulator of RNase III)
VIRIRVERGDISSFRGDGVVNAANNHLRMGAGVAGALLHAGGPLIQEECNDYVRANGPLGVGGAALTGGGNLPARWVIHAAAMGDTPPTADSIRSSTRHALRIAQEAGMRTVAFPILGTGIGGFPFGEAARLMVAEIRTHADGADLPEDVALYAYEEERAAELRRVLEEK